MSDEKPIGQVDPDTIKFMSRTFFGNWLIGTVEETLDAVLDARADQLCGARRSSAAWLDTTRAGSYERTLQTSAASGLRQGSKLRRQTFETAIINRYRRRRELGEEALIEMYWRALSASVEDVTEALGDAGQPEVQGATWTKRYRQDRGLAEPPHRG